MLQMTKLVESKISGGASPLRAKQAAVKQVVDMVNSKDKSKQLSTSEFSIRECWEALVGPTRNTLACEYALHRQGFIADPLEVLDGNSLQEAAMNSQLFSIATGNVIQRAVIEGYELEAGVLDRLVMPFNSSLKQETFSGFQAIEETSEVKEGKDYPDANFTDKWVRGPEPSKYGHILKVTEEMLAFDQTAKILDQAQELGRYEQYKRELYGLRAISDASGYECYYPQGVQKALYRTAAVGADPQQRVVSKKASNALDNWSNIQACVELANSHTDEQGTRRIAFRAKILLFPFELVPGAARALAPLQVIKNDNATAGTAINDIRTANFVRDILGGDVEPVMSRILSTVSTSTWYLGDPKRQFKEQIIFPLQTFAIRDNDLMKLSNDTVAAFKVRRKSRVQCIEDAFWMQNTAGA